MRERKGRGEGRKEGADRKFKKQRNSISLKTSVHAAKRLVGAFPFLLKNPAWPVGVEGSMRSSIFHSDWSGTGWSAGDNRWSQLFRWPGKSSNRPGRRIARRTKNIFNGRKKKKRKKEKEEKNEERERERERTSRWLHVRIIVIGFDLYKFFGTMPPSPPRPRPPEIVNFHFDVSFDQIFAEQNGSRVAGWWPLIDSLFRPLSTLIFYSFYIHKRAIFSILVKNIKHRHFMRIIRFLSIKSKFV